MASQSGQKWGYLVILLIHLLISLIHLVILIIRGISNITK